MRHATALGRDPNSLRELSDRLNALVTDLSARLDTIRSAPRSLPSQPEGTTLDATRAALDRIDTSGHILIEALRSLGAILSQLALNLSTVDHSVAQSLPWP